MAYTKTEKVLADIESRRTKIIATTIDIIARNGIDVVTTNLVAAEAGVSVGLLYKHFPDKNEMLAAIASQLLERDLAAMSEAAAAEKGSAAALVASLLVFYSRLQKPRLVKAMGEQPVYRTGMRNAFEKLIRAAQVLGTPKEITLAAAATLGALIAQSDVGGGPKKHAPEAVLFVLRGIGMQSAWSRQAVDKRVGA